MRIDLQCADPDASSGLRDFIARRMRLAIGNFGDRVQWTRVKVADVDGPGGGADKRCVVQLRLRNRPDVIFAVTAAGARVAVDRAAERVAQVLVRRLGTRRNASALGAPMPAGA